MIDHLDRVLEPQGIVGTDPAPLVPAEEQAIIDQALQLVYSHHHRLRTQLWPAGFQPLSLAQLRDGPLGQDLRRLAAVARQERQMSRERVMATLAAVLDLLFWPMAADEYTVPRTFWETELGTLLARAKYAAYAGEDLTSIGEAATQLGVSRPTIYRWMDDGLLDAVRDDQHGRTWVTQRTIDQLHLVAHDLSRSGQLHNSDQSGRPGGA